jgi:hypothetical protein
MRGKGKVWTKVIEQRDFRLSDSDRIVRIFDDAWDNMAQKGESDTSRGECYFGWRQYGSTTR